MSERPALRHPAWCLFLLPLLLLVLLLLVSVGVEVYYSFTQYTVLSPPEAVGWGNYATLLGDELFGKAVGNTALYLVLGSGVCVALGWLCGTGASRMPFPLRAVLLVLAGLGTFLAFCQTAWLPYVLQEDSYGLLNSWLLDSHQITEPILWGEQYPVATQLFSLSLLGLGPAFFLFYIGGRLRRTRAAWHIAVAALPVFLLFEWPMEYPMTDSLPEMFYNEQFILCNVGESGAYFVALLLLTGALIGVAQGLVWAVYRLPGVGSVSPEKLTVWHWCGGALGFVGGVLVLAVLVLVVNLAVRPLDEFYLIPAPLFTRTPTLANFQTLENLWVPFSSYLRVGEFSLVVSIVYLVVIFLPAAFFAFFAPRWRRWVQMVWLGLMCLTPFSIHSFSWHDWEMVNKKWLLLFLEYLHSPLLPVCLLLTVLILRRSGAGCASFRAYFRAPHRVGGAALGAMGCCVLSVPALLLGSLTNHLIYSEQLKFPLTIIGLLSTKPGAAAAATLRLLGITAGVVGLGALLLMLAFFVVLPKKAPQKQTICPN